MDVIELFQLVGIVSALGILVCVMVYCLISLDNEGFL
jgi:hypothetical protein